jgi:hypothetical protein
VPLTMMPVVAAKPSIPSMIIKSNL